jgi:hypothetical protein
MRTARSKRAAWLLVRWTQRYAMIQNTEGIHRLKCFDGERIPVPRSPANYTGTDDMLLAPQSDEGHLAIWCLDDREVIASCGKTHIDKISALQFGVFSAPRDLVLAGVDGTPRLCDMELTDLLRLTLTNRPALMTQVKRPTCVRRRWRLACPN